VAHSRGGRLLKASALATACALGAAVLTSCSATDPLSSDEFWQGQRFVHVEEVDPADDLNELVEDSSLIVQGAVVRTEAGPESRHPQDDGTVYTSKSTVLTVSVSQVIVGTPVDEVKVWTSQENPNDRAPGALPEAEFLWFLKPSDRPEFFLLTSMTGVIGLDDSGRLVTFRDPNVTADIIPEGVTDLEELVQRVRSLG